MTARARATAPRPLRALIFDCDGVLAETERDLHLPAFNRAFEACGVPLHWSDAEYGRRLAIAGGKERIAAALTREVLDAWGSAHEPAAVGALAARVHARKTEIASAMLEREPPPPRPGVRRIASAARAAGWMIAVASTSAETLVRRIAQAAFGAELAAAVTVFAGDAVDAKKPDPAIYELALASLGIAADEALAIEDSRAGLRAARAAGLPCIVTVSEYTADQDFEGAALVVSDLGDPGRPMRVLENPHGLSLDGQLELDDLAALACSAA